MYFWNFLRFCGLFTGFILITPSDATVTGGLLRLTCTGQIHQSTAGAIGAMVCMELWEIPWVAGNGLTASDNNDRLYLDALVQQINNKAHFSAEDFRKNGNIGTLAGFMGKKGSKEIQNYYRIDSQIASNDKANVAYQVYKSSKAKCLIYYLTNVPVPAGFPPNTRLTQHFPDNIIKAMVQDGLDIGVLRPPFGPKETAIEWRVIPVPVLKLTYNKYNTYKLNKNDVRTALRNTYNPCCSRDIMHDDFPVIRPAKSNGVPTRISILPNFDSEKNPIYVGY